MTEGDVVLTALPQADGRVKNRPAIVLRSMPPHGDLLVCGVSSQLHQEVVGFDETIKPGDPDFVASGLKAPSLIRLGFLVVLPKQHNWRIVYRIDVDAIVIAEIFEKKTARTPATVINTCQKRLQTYDRVARQPDK